MAEAFTAMYYVIVVKIINCLQDLLDCPGGIFLSELAVLADAVEEFASSCELCDNVVLVLRDESSVLDPTIFDVASVPLTQTNHEI